MNSVGTTAARDPHHLELYSAIQSKQQITDMLRSLLRRIQEGEASERPLMAAAPKDVPEMPTLMHVLQSGASRIREMNNEQLELIQTIEEILF